MKKFLTMFCALFLFTLNSAAFADNEINGFNGSSTQPAGQIMTDKELEQIGPCPKGSYCPPEYQIDITKTIGAIRERKKTTEPCPANMSCSENYRFPIPQDGKPAAKR